VYLCEDTLESIFTAIYTIYENKHNFPDTRLLLEWEPLLLAEYVTVEADAEKAAKVIRTIHRQFGERDVHHIFMALSSPDGVKAEAVYKTIVYGLMNKVKPGHLFDHLADRYVLQTLKLSRNAGRECQHLKGFLRFRELENGILFAPMGPKNHVLTELMEHFSDRFPSENFMIYDEGRQIFGVHKAKGNWFLISAEVMAEKIKTTNVSDAESYYSGLFQHFCQTIAIKERKNPDLQSIRRNSLPCWIR